MRTPVMIRWIAVFTGFLLAQTLMPKAIAHSDEKLAHLMAETVRLALETDRKIPPNEASRIAEVFEQFWERATSMANEKLQEALRK